MKYSIIVPNYNGAENLLKNIPKLTKVLEGEDCEIVIVDDSSTDESLEVIARLQEESSVEISSVKTSSNKGFSPAVNLGVEKSSGEIVILLNSDVYPKSSFLKELEKHFKKETTFAVGFMDESIEGDSVVFRGRGVGEWKRGFLIHSAGDLDKTNSLWASGGSSAFRKSLWEKLGGLNEIYKPFYWEDIDLSYRALKAGYEIIFDPEIKVVHEHEKGAIRKKYSSSHIKTISLRNQYVFTWVNADLGNVVVNMMWAPYYVIKSLITLDFAFISGFFKFLILLPEVIGIRFKTQKLFVKRDFEVIIKE